MLSLLQKFENLSEAFSQWINTCWPPSPGIGFYYMRTLKMLQCSSWPKTPDQVTTYHWWGCWPGTPADSIFLKDGIGWDPFLCSSSLDDHPPALRDLAGICYHHWSQEETWSASGWSIFELHPAHSSFFCKQLWEKGKEQKEQETMTEWFYPHPSTQQGVNTQAQC